MTKELTDKVINEIVEAQFKLIMERDCNNVLCPSLLKEYLIEGINNYKSKTETVKEIDISFMKSLDKQKGSRVSTRLINSARDYFRIEFPNNPSESQLLELYLEAQRDLNRNGNYFEIKNYGLRTHTFLEEYLKKKKLV